MVESLLDTKEIAPEELKAKGLTHQISVERENVLTWKIVLQKSWIKRFKSFTLRCVILSC